MYKDKIESLIDELIEHDEDLAIQVVQTNTFGEYAYLIYNMNDIDFPELKMGSYSNVIYELENKLSEYDTNNDYYEYDLHNELALNNPTLMNGVI